jgi:FkbM family methyltransferase
MDPSALLRNIHHTMRVCPTWKDRLNRLRWLYKRDADVRSSKYRRQIRFSYPAPLSDISLTVRSNRGSDSFICSEVFDHRYYDFDLPFTPRTILDLGANAGFVTLYFARKYPSAELACVEPMPDNVSLLRENLRLNSVDAKVFDAAVGVEDGQLSMLVAPLDYGHKVAEMDFGPAYEGQTIEVEAVSAFTLMRRLGWDRISLLKVDIEGYEGILLKRNCDWLHNVDALCIECHEGYGEADLISLAQTYGFRPPEQLPGTWLLTR